MPKVKKFETVNDRIYYLEIECKWVNIVIVNCYALTEENEDEIKNLFYDRLDTVYDLISSNKVKLLTGDFNAKIRQELIHRPTIRIHSLHEKSNDNDTRLINSQ